MPHLSRALRLNPLFLDAYLVLLPDGYCYDEVAANQQKGFLQTAHS